MARVVILDSPEEHVLDFLIHLSACKIGEAVEVKPFTITRTADSTYEIGVNDEEVMGRVLYTLEHEGKFKLNRKGTGLGKI